MPTIEEVQAKYGGKFASSSLDVRYVAGFFNGEGHVATYERRDGYDCLQVNIAQKTPEVLYAIQSRWRGAMTKDPRTGVYCLRLAGRFALRFLIDVAPWVYVKRQKVLANIARWQDYKWRSYSFRPGWGACGHKKSPYGVEMRCLRCTRARQREYKQRVKQRKGDQALGC